jgi:hypothetical protein
MIASLSATSNTVALQNISEERIRASGEEDERQKAMMVFYRVVGFTSIQVNN